MPIGKKRLCLADVEAQSSGVDLDQLVTNSHALSGSPACVLVVTMI